MGTPEKVVDHQPEEEQQLCVAEHMFTTGQRVEVSSNEEGFEGAWFVGTVVESNRKSKTKLLVEYETLLADDGKKALKEYITLPFIRPIPPLESVLPPSTCFQVSDMVDAFHRDAWWAGVIIRILDDNQFLVAFENPYEELTFSASSLRYHLEWHDGKWIRSQLQKTEGQKVGTPDTMKVRQSRSKRRGKKSKVRKSGTTATGDTKSINEKGGGSEGISNIDNDAMELHPKKPSEVHPLPHHQQLVDTEIQTTKSSSQIDTMELQDKKPSEVHPIPHHQQLVDTEIQTTKSSSQIDTMELQDKKPSEVHPIPHHQQLVDTEIQTTKSSSQKDTMELQEKKTSEVHLLPHHQQLIDTEIETTKENDGENGVDEKNKKRKRGTLLLLKLLSSEQSPQKREKTILPTPVKSPSTAPPLLQNNEKRMRRISALTSPLSTLEQSTEVKRKRGRPPLKRTINLAETTKASAIDSSDRTKGEASLKANNDKVNDDKKLSTENFCGVPTLSAEEGISSQMIIHDMGASPLCVVTQQDGGERGYGYEIVIAKDNEEGHKKEEILKKETERREKEEVHIKDKEIVEQSWPFEKCSPLWKTIESMQVFRKTPQKPHFSSLSKCEEQFREGLAIGCMVTFASTVDRISKLQMSDPTSVIDRYLETLAELENHGFDVVTFRAFLIDLLGKKDRECQLQESSKKVVDEIVEYHFEKTRLENEIRENEAKIKEHQEKVRANTEKKDVMDKAIAMLLSTKDQIGEEIAHVHLNFQKLVASLL